MFKANSLIKNLNNPHIIILKKDKKITTHLDQFTHIIKKHGFLLPVKERTITIVKSYSRSYLTDRIDKKQTNIVRNNPQINLIS